MRNVCFYSCGQKVLACISYNSVMNGNTVITLSIGLGGPVQTVKTLIRRHSTRCLIRFYTVCCSFSNMLDIPTISKIILFQFLDRYENEIKGFTIFRANTIILIVTIMIIMGKHHAFIHVCMHSYFYVFLYTLPAYFRLENMPIQIYWKFYHQKMKIFREKNLIFFIFLLKHRLWLLVRTASTRRF